MPAFRHARGGQEHPAVYRRNVLRGPGQTNVDFSIGKQCNVRERQYVEFRAEFFNRFNLPIRIIRRWNGSVRTLHRFQGAVVTVLRDSRHVAPMDQPEEFNRVVRKFLAL